MHPPERVRFMRDQIKLSLGRASAIITDSEYIRLELARHFSWPIERIFSVPLASSPEFKPRSYEELLPNLELLNLIPGNYTLFSGTIEPRKNISTLLDAYANLSLGIRKSCPLVVVGYKGWKSEDLHRRFDKGQSEGWLKYLGFVSNDLLATLMSGARLFVYPSYYEGFGLPVLEAMASGVPVICSNASSLSEVAGDAAAFHAPEDVDGLLNLLRIGLENNEWRTGAIKAGFIQSQNFSWDRCIEETLKVYKSVLND